MSETCPIGERRRRRRRRRLLAQHGGSVCGRFGGAGEEAGAAGAMSCCQTSVCTQAFGGEQLLQLLKNYSRSAGLKTSITVGVVGYPNVGTPRRQLRFLVFRLAPREHTAVP